MLLWGLRMLLGLLTTFRRRKPDAGRRTRSCGGLDPAPVTELSGIFVSGAPKRRVSSFPAQIMQESRISAVSAIELGRVHETQVLQMPRRYKRPGPNISSGAGSEVKFLLREGRVK